MNRILAAMLMPFLVCALCYAQSPRPKTPAQAEDSPLPEQTGETKRISSREARNKKPLFGARPHPRFQILNLYPAVQEELKLTPAQKTQLAKIQTDVGRQAARTREALKSVAAQQPDPAAAEAIRHQASITGVLLGAEVEPAMLKILNRSQRTRLDEIRLQACGPWAFLLPEVQSRLNLAPEQVLMLQQIVSDFRDAEIEQSKGTSEREYQAALAVYNHHGQAVHPGESQKVPRATPGSSQGSQGQRQDGPSDQQDRNVDPRLVVAANARLKAREEGRNERARMYQAGYQRIFKVLTRKQRALYQRMLGAPFIANGQLIPRSSTDSSKGLETAPRDGK